MKSLPHNLYLAAQVRALDQTAIETHGIAGITLMEGAGSAVFDALRHRWPRARRLAVVCGTGNNGGDGFIVARLFHEAGLWATVFQLGDEATLSGDALIAAKRAGVAGVTVQPFPSNESADELLEGFDLIVDALLGTGLTREVTGKWRETITAINDSGLPVIAVDIPSGLEADTGAELGIAVRAEMTVSFVGLKQGLFTGQGSECCGEVLFDDLQVPAALYKRVRPSARLYEGEQRNRLLAPRSRTAHKGDNGHLLIVGGDTGMAGAVRLAGEAALRTGAGLVSIATRASHAAFITQARPELMSHGVEESSELHHLIQRANVIAIGPGLGRGRWSQALMTAVLESTLPLVVDADGLNLLATEPFNRNNWVLTPHPGEAARLLGTTTAAVQADRFSALRAIQKRYGGVAILKGAGSLICWGDDPVALCRAGNPGMATAGMGDLLTGVIAALMAQGIKPIEAAPLGVWLHAQAGDEAAAAGERGLLASDLLTSLRRLVN